MKTTPLRTLVLATALLALAAPASQALYIHASAFNLTPTGIFNMRLNGTIRSTPTFAGYDAVDVDGNARFDGTLRISLISGFTPADGDSFDLFNWGTEDGSGPTFDLPPLDAGLFWDTHTFTTDGTLSVTNAPVPEPGTAGLLLLGAAVCLRRRVNQMSVRKYRKANPAVTPR